jgi:hypothetical protein
MRITKWLYLLASEVNFATINPVIHARIAQLVERIHGKDEVSGSNPDSGSRALLVTEAGTGKAL